MCYVRRKYESIRRLSLHIINCLHTLKKHPHNLRVILCTRYETPDLQSTLILSLIRPTGLHKNVEYEIKKNATQK